MSLGGEWIRFAQGKTLVGVDESDVDFNKVEKELGEKTHKLTINEMPSHKHNLAFDQSANGGTQWAKTGGNSGGPYYSDIYISSTGGSQAHNNIQPSITVYFWKRVA